MESNWRVLMRALIAGGGMAGLMTALALRGAGVFTTIDVFEQTRTPSTAGAGLNIPPNAARLARGLGVDLDGGDPQGPHGAGDGGRAAVLRETRVGWGGRSSARRGWSGRPAPPRGSRSTTTRRPRITPASPTCTASTC